MGSKGNQFQLQEILNAVYDDTTRELAVKAGSVVLSAGDIEIGAVEIKDATGADRAPVDATAGLKVDLGADNDVVITSGDVSIMVSNTAVSETNPVSVEVAVSNTAVAETNPMPVELAVNSTAVAGSNPLPVYRDFDSIVATAVSNVSAGTAIQLSSFAAKFAIFQGTPANTDVITIGGADVSASAFNGINLSAREVFYTEIPGEDPSCFYYDAAVSGEDLSIMFYL